MRRVLPGLMIGLLSGSLAWAESPADRIRDLYEAVPYERVQASPQADILAHIERMRARQEAPDAGFAVPELDLGAVLRETEGEDVLMNPRVLEAIARMPADRAAEVLRMIEDRRAGLNPVADVPALSMSDAPLPESLALRGWRLDRDEAGAPFLEREGDSSSRVMLVPSMILADFGRVVSIRDDETAFQVTLESGDVIDGAVRQAPSEATPAVVAGPTDPGLVVPRTPAAERVRPVARPLVADGAAEPVRVATPPARSLRPRLRPAGLSGQT